jgi:hypothetical protein
LWRLYLADSCRIATRIGTEVPQIEASADLGGEQPHIPGLGPACLDYHVVFWLEVANVGRGACLSIAQMLTLSACEVQIITSATHIYNTVLFYKY